MSTSSEISGSARCGCGKELRPGARFCDTCGAPVERPVTATSALATVNPASLIEAPPPYARRLDLGCGQNPKEGFEGVDVRGGKAKHEVDLFKFPWPFEDESVEEINASHLLEHVPAREIEERDLVLASPKELPLSGGIAGARDADVRAQFLGQDMLFAFVDECHRILKPDCWMHVVVPSGRSDRAFWDPTHRRFFMQQTFLYFARDWRKLNGLDHYRVRCNFAVDVGQTFPSDEALRHPEAQAHRFLHYWNVTVDWVAKLQKKPL